jgi:hypothetical protein
MAYELFLQKERILLSHCFLAHAPSTKEACGGPGYFAEATTAFA